VLAKVIAGPPDVLVLDLVLCDGRGVELCGEVRRLSGLAISVLSAVVDELQKLRALDAGADAFLTRPFGIDDLLTRLRAWLRAPWEIEAIRVLEIGELTIDVGEGRVTRAGEEVNLEPVELALVRELVQHHGRLVTDQQLLRALWEPESRDETSELRVPVADIRRALERDPWLSEHLTTEPRVGDRARDHGRRARRGVMR
jgi:two-component system KDP operon response regulator KdpE